MLISDMSGFRLSGVLTFAGRQLPAEARCGVCRLCWDLAASADHCPHCRSSRVASWQRVTSSSVVEPGAVLVPRQPDEEIEAALVVAIERIKKAVVVVAFRGEPFPSKTEIDLASLARFDLGDPARAARFSNFALCPRCDHVFRIENWGLDRAQVAEARRDLEARLAVTVDEKRRLKAETPRHFAAILRATEDAARIRRELEGAMKRQCPPQEWCPRCLCMEFPLS